MTIRSHSRTVSNESFREALSPRKADLIAANRTGAPGSGVVAMSRIAPPVPLASSALRVVYIFDIEHFNAKDSGLTEHLGANVDIPK